MDKLAQKFTAQEMIKANAAAEAAELQRTRDQVKQYDSCLQDMKKAGDGLNELIESGLGRIRDLQQSTEDIQADVKKYIDEKNTELTDFVHKENVKVYRNVQAVVVDELKNQSESLEEQLQRVIKKQNGILGVSVTALVFALLAAAGVAVQLLLEFGIL